MNLKKGGEIPSNIIDAVNNSNSLMEVGTNLDEMGVEYEFNTYDMPMPPAMYKIKFGDKNIYILNKNYVDGADYVKDEIGVGIMAKGGNIEDYPTEEDNFVIIQNVKKEQGESDFYYELYDKLVAYGERPKIAFAEMKKVFDNYEENMYDYDNLPFAKGGKIYDVDFDMREREFGQGEEQGNRGGYDYGELRSETTRVRANNEKEAIFKARQELDLFNRSYNITSVSEFAKGGNVKIDFSDKKNYRNTSGKPNWDKISEKDLRKNYKKMDNDFRDRISYKEFKKIFIEQNVEIYAKGGEIVEVRYRGLPINESMLGKPVMSEETTDILEDEFRQDLTFTPIEETNMKPLSYENSRKFILDFDKNFKGLLKGYAKGGSVSYDKMNNSDSNEYRIIERAVRGRDVLLRTKGDKIFVIDERNDKIYEYDNSYNNKQKIEDFIDKLKSSYAKGGKIKVGVNVKYPKATMIGEVISMKDSGAIPNEKEIVVRYNDGKKVSDLASSFIYVNDNKVFAKGGTTDADYWKQNKGDFAGWIEIDEREVDDDYIDRHFAKFCSGCGQQECRC